MGDQIRFERVCRPGLEAAGISRWIEIQGAGSIGEAYEAGRRLASTACVVYLHDDTRLLHPAVRVASFLRRRPAGTLAGAIGSLESDSLPWVSNPTLVGSVRGVSNLSRRVEGPTDVGILDGVVLAERSGGPWAPLSGWHGYDAHRSLAAPACYVLPELACEHLPRPKPRSYHLAHIRACRSLAARWQRQCVIGIGPSGR